MLPPVWQQDMHAWGRKIVGMKPFLVWQKSWKHVLIFCIFSGVQVQGNLSWMQTLGQHRVWSCVLVGLSGNTPLCARTHNCRGQCAGNLVFASADQWDTSHGVYITRQQVWAVLRHMANRISAWAQITCHMRAEQHVIQVVNS